MKCFVIVKIIFILVLIFCPMSALAVGQIFISELAWMGTEVSSNDEWIELRNESGSDVALEGWTLSAVDGSPSINLSGAIPAGGYFLLERTDDESVPGVVADLIYVGSLGNSGEVLELRDGEGVLVDSVSAGDGWMAGDNVSKLTMERAGSDWGSSVLVGGTPGGANGGVVGVGESGSGEVVEGDVEEVVEVVEVVVKSSGGSVVDNRADGGVDLSYKNLEVSEIYANPVGSDSVGEFIEFYNDGESAIDLSGFKIGDESNRRYKIRDVVLGSGDYWVLYRVESGIALNNDEDSVFVYLPGSERAFLSVSYEGAEEGLSYALDDGFRIKEYVWSQIVTPGKKNDIKEKNLAPVANIEILREVEVGKPVVFDGSDSFDLNGDALSFEWDFGDGFGSLFELTEHTFFTAGKYEIVLRVSDGVLRGEVAKVIELEERVDEAESLKAASDLASNFAQQFGAVEGVDGDGAVGIDSGVVISEVMPNPEGEDGEEWIELNNLNEVDVNLKGWVIDDKEGGSKAYEFKEDLLIGALGYLILGKEDTKLALNNSFDEVRLFNVKGEVVSEVEYAKAKKGEAYTLVGGVWFWTEGGTPGSENELSEGVNLGELDFEMTVDGMGGLREVVYDGYADVALRDVSLFEVGDKVRTAGIVVVLPGVLGTQVFYIVTDGVGVQVYNSRKDFPELSIGDYVVVEGEVSESNGELRIKTMVGESVVIVDEYGEPEAMGVGFEEFGVDLVGQFVKVGAVVTEREGRVVYLDDGEGEIEVYLKSGAGIKVGDIEEGENYEVFGIVGMTKSGVRLMPRSIDDFVLVKEGGEVGGGLGGVGGEGGFGKGEWVLPVRSKKQEVFEYLLIGGGLLSLGLIGWVVRLEQRGGGGVG